MKTKNRRNCHRPKETGQKRQRNVVCGCILARKRTRTRTLVNPNQVWSRLIAMCFCQLLKLGKCTPGMGEVTCVRNRKRRHMRTLVCLLCDFLVNKHIYIVKERFIQIFPREGFAEIDNVIQKCIWKHSGSRTVKTILTNSRMWGT